MCIFYGNSVITLNLSYLTDAIYFVCSGVLRNIIFKKRCYFVNCVTLNLNQ